MMYYVGIVLLGSRNLGTRSRVYLPKMESSDKEACHAEAARLLQCRSGKTRSCPTVILEKDASGRQWTPVDASGCQWTQPQRHARCPLAACPTGPDIATRSPFINGNQSATLHQTPTKHKTAKLFTAWAVRCGLPFRSHHRRHEGLASEGPTSPRRLSPIPSGHACSWSWSWPWPWPWPCKGQMNVSAPLQKWIRT